jgi:hypothetical protein
LDDSKTFRQSAKLRALQDDGENHHPKKLTDDSEVNGIKI